MFKLMLLFGQNQMHTRDDWGPPEDQAPMTETGRTVWFCVFALMAMAALWEWYKKNRK